MLTPKGLLLALCVLEAALLLPLLLLWWKAWCRVARVKDSCDNSPSAGGEPTTSEPLLPAVPKEGGLRIVTVLRILGWLGHSLLLVVTTIAIIALFLLCPQSGGLAPEPPEAPGIPWGLHILNISADSLSLSWTPPDTGTAPINSYELQQAVVLGGRAMTYITRWKALGISLTLGDLSANTTYCFRLRACGAVGCGLYSAPACVSTKPAAPPPAPSALRPLHTNTSSITFTWARSATHGVQICAYEVHVAKSSAPTRFASACNVTVGADDRRDLCRCTVGHLTADTVYQWRVRATSTAGTGPWSLPSHAHTNRPDAVVPPAPSTVPTLFLHAAASLTFLWAAWEDGGAEVLSYDATVTMPGGEHSVVTHIWSCRLALLDLKPATQYCVAVRAINSVGAGPYGHATCGRTDSLDPPPPPMLLRQPLSLGSDTVAVQWVVPMNGEPLQFELQRTNWWDDRPFFTVYKGNAMQFTEVGPLLPATTYEFQVRASNSAGWSNWSTAVPYTTLEAGSCGNTHDVAAYKNTKLTMKGSIQYCLVRCIRSESCATTCLSNRVGLSPACGHCWVDEGHCTLQQCLFPCMAPDSDVCKACSEAKCFPQCVRCSGVDRIYFPP